MVLMRVTEPSTSCAMSLSPVEMSTVLTGLCGAAREGADDIIRLHARDTQQRQTLRADDLQQRIDLRRQVSGHRGPVRLVLGEQLIAKGLAGCIEDHGDAGAAENPSRTSAAC